MKADTDAAIDAFVKNERGKKVFWALFVAMAGLVAGPGDSSRQRAYPTMGRPRLFQSAVRTRCRAVFFKIYKERSSGWTTEAIVLWKSATETSAWKTGNLSI